ncbi:MAG: hypothetical protein OXC40_00155 [Proteobacteria bacterium]|nr:hypothetical protein [Pseudomonadota bacterium]
MLEKTIQLDKLTIIIQTSETETRFILSGQLSESFDQREIPKAKTSTVIFDLAEVNYVSSVGIREWVLLVNHWSKHHKLYYERCSIYFVDQMNMVPDCLGPAKMSSFFAPYFCELCNSETTRLLKIKEHLDTVKNSRAPTFICDCGKTELEFDALEDSYFSFLKFK